MAIKLIFLLLLFNSHLLLIVGKNDHPCPEPTNFGGLVGEFEKIINGDGDIVSFGWAYYEFATSLWEFIPEIGGAMSSVAHAVVSPPPEYAECLNAIYELIERSTERILDAIDTLKHELLKNEKEKEVYEDIVKPIARYNDMFKHMLKINDTAYKHVYQTVVGDCIHSSDGYMALMRAFEARFYLNCASKSYGSVSNESHGLVPTKKSYGSVSNKSYALVPTKKSYNSNGNESYDLVSNKSYDDKDDDYSCYPSVMKKHYKNHPGALHKITRLILKQSYQVSLIVSVCLNITNADPEKNIKDINNAFEVNARRLSKVTSYVTGQLLGQESGNFEKLKKMGITMINKMNPRDSQSIENEFATLGSWINNEFSKLLSFYMYRIVLITDPYEDYLMVCPNMSCIFISSHETKSDFSMIITQTMVDRQSHYEPVVKEYAEKRYQTLSVLTSMYEQDKVNMNEEVLKELMDKSSMYRPWRGYFSGLFIFKLNKNMEELKYYSTEIGDFNMGIIEQPYKVKEKPRYVEFALF